MAHWVSSLAATALESVLSKDKSGRSKLSAVISTIVRFPIKLVAAFFAAPFLAFRVARYAKDPWRRRIAGFGLFLAMVVGWFAGTALGTAAAAFLIMAKVGLIWGLAFFVGTATSVVLSVAFSLLALNATAWLFLGMSSEDVVAHLRTIST